MSIGAADTFLDKLLYPFLELPEETAHALDRDGYIILPNMIEAESLQKLRATFDQIVDSEGEGAAQEHHQEPGSHRIANLVNKGRIFEDTWCNPLLLACCYHMFGRPFKLSSLNGREALKGGGHQPLHSDWKGERGPIERAHSCNALWALDDLTLENGAPRLVPGSNRIPGHLEDCLKDPEAAHADQIVAQVPAGSVIMINAHTWHGGTVNSSGERRRVLHAYYTAREHSQQQDQHRWLKTETENWLSEQQRWLLDVD